MSTKTTAPERIQVTSHLQWVRLDQMNVNPQAQRALSQAWVDELAKQFDPDLMGFIHLSFRDGWYYIIDGQHRQMAAVQYLGSDQQVQCHVYTGLTNQQEAQLFLDLNKKKAQSPISKYKVSLTAGAPDECDVDRIVRALGITIGSSTQLEEITCITAILAVYRKNGPGALSFALRVIRDAYGYEGFKREVISGLALVTKRYGSQIDEARLTKRLTTAGLVTLKRRGRDLREVSGSPADQCYSCGIVEFYNRGSGTRVDPWWNFKVVAAVSA